MTGLPRTWEELRKAAATLKKRGKPYGQTLGHTFGDAPSFAYPLLWSFGGAETDTTGRKVVLNSKGAVESVKFMQVFWRDACDEGGLAWDDTNNNRSFLAREISATLNGLSIYLVAKRSGQRILDERGQPLWQDIDHAPLPAGPAGAFAYHLPLGHGVLKYSKNQKTAKDLLRLLHSKENFTRWLRLEQGFSVGPSAVWENDAMWQDFDPAVRLVRTVARGARMFGYAGPPSARATEALTRYVIVDMFAKAVQGMRAEDAVRWADAELRRIYEI